MTHPVLLVSTDVELGERVRRALPAGIPLNLELAPVYRSSPGRSWLLVLVDAHAPQPMTRPAPGPDDAPVLWLGERPRIASPEAGRWRAPGPILDCLDREQPASKLGFVLHQHLAAAYLRRVRAPAAEGGAGASLSAAELKAQINNALAGILGNAELAADLAHAAGRRLPPVLERRLRCILDLAMQMRELLTSAAAVPS